MRTMKALGLIMLALAFALAGWGAANPPRSLSKKQVKALLATAKTPADHLALANYYREEAAELEKKATYHDEMRVIYTKSPLPTDGKLPYSLQMKNHCADLVSELRKAAEKANGLAASHQEMADAAAKQ